jgi:predicted GIY-YIG superfamily endonuclease
MRTGIIYKLTSPSNKVYIGQTIDEKKRLAKHKRDSKTGVSKLYSEIRTYGFENFTYEVIYTIKGIKEDIKPILNAKEKEYINKYDSALNGLNSTNGNKQITQILDYDGKTKEYLIEEAFLAYNSFHYYSTPKWLKEVFINIYNYSKENEYVCYYVYDSKENTVRLKSILNNVKNIYPYWDNTYPYID